MENLDVLKDYLIELDFFARSFIEQRVRKYGVESVLKNQFESLDCSRHTSTGELVQRTDSYAYKNELSQTIEIIKLYGEDKSDLFDRVLALHALNLQYEKEHPPVPVKTKRASSRKKESKEKKETAAERKAKEKAAKIGKLSLNLKLTK